MVFATGQRERANQGGVCASVRQSKGLVCVMCGLLACGTTSSFDPVSDTVYLRHVTPAMVTGAALAALGPDGRLALPLPNPPAPAISLSEARTQTLQFARYVTNNVLLRSGVEDGRGGFWVDPHLMTLCGDAYFMRSYFGPINHDSLGEPGLSILRRYGPRWMITLCGAANDPQMTVQVAIDGNDVRFTDGEPIEPYHILGTAWSASGVPLNWPDAFTISAERAVRFVWETFGVRVTEVPELFTRGDGGTYGDFLGPRRLPIPAGSRSCHRWRVVLESDVKIRGLTSFRTDTTNVLYVSALTCGAMDVDPYVHMPVADQPSMTNLEYLDENVSPPRTWTLTVPHVSPVRFEVAVRVP